MPTLAARDYRGALEFLRVAQEAEDTDPFGVSVLDALRRLIPCSIATYRERDDRTGAYVHRASGIDVREVERIWDRYPAVRTQDPLPGVCPRGAVRLPAGISFQFSDFISLSRFHRLDLYERVCRPVGTNYVMKLFLPLARRSAGFVLEAERRDFSGRDRDLLDVLAPHLLFLRRRGDAHALIGREVDAASSLTPREREVLALVAQGMTNPEIASALLIAPGTVRKHLDNVYRKLGVRGRAEAVAVCGAGSTES
jgi:DNA-binding CsgD family transcriptional regulator